MEDRKTKWLTYILMAGACLSCTIGAGTCSGQEIMQFLVSFGYWGIGICIITLVYYWWSAAVLIDLGRRLKADNSLIVYKFLLGDKLGVLFDWFGIITIFILFVMMLAGAGSTISQYTGMPELPGRTIVSIVVFMSAMLGIKKIIDAMGAIGPIIIVLAVIVGIASLVQNAGKLATAGEALQNVEVQHPDNVNVWFVSGIFYVAFVILMNLPFFTRVGRERATCKKDAVIVGLLIGVGFTAVATLFYLAEFASIEEVYDKQIPTLTLAQNVSPVIALLFTIMILLAIYSTAVPLCWTVANRVAGSNKKVYYIAVTVVCIIGFFGSLFPFDKIINVIYPYLGFLGVIVTVGMIISYHVMKKRITKYEEIINSK